MVKMVKKDSCLSVGLTTLQNLTMLNSKGRKFVFLDYHSFCQFRREKDYSNNKTHRTLFLNGAK